MLMKTLVRKSAEEIISAIPDLSNEQKAELVELEGERDDPRDEVLEALGINPKKNLEEDPDLNPEEIKKAQELLERAKARKLHPHDELDSRRPFGMVHHKGLKQFMQDGKIFDRATKKLICTVEEAVKEKEAAAKG